jgi:penicillin amidase
MSLGRTADLEVERRRHPVLRVLLILFLLLLLALAGAVLTGGVWLKHKMRSSLPELDGSVSTPGLTAPVAVRRDQHGVPHMQAANLDDLLFARDSGLEAGGTRPHAARPGHAGNGGTANRDPR